MSYSSTYTTYTAPSKAYTKHANHSEVTVFLRGEYIAVVYSENIDQALNVINLSAHQVNIYLTYESVASAKGHRILLNASQEEEYSKQLIALDRTIVLGGYCSQHQPPIHGLAGCKDCDAALDRYNQALQEYSGREASVTKRLNAFTVRLQYHLGYVPPTCYALGPLFGGIAGWFRLLFNKDQTLAPRHVRPTNPHIAQRVPVHIKRKPGMGLPRYYLFLQGRYLGLYSDEGTRAIANALATIRESGGHVLVHNVINRKDGLAAQEEYDRMVLANGGVRVWKSRENLSQKKAVIVNITSDELGGTDQGFTDFPPSWETACRCNGNGGISPPGLSPNCSKCHGDIHKQNTQGTHEREHMRGKYDAVFQSVKGLLHMQFAREIV